MKILKILSATFLILSLSNCVYTKDTLWGNDYSKESFIGYFIDKETKAVVLVGDVKNNNQNESRYYYYIDAEDKIFSDAIKLGTNERKIKFNIGPIIARGSTVKPLWIWLGFNKHYLSKDEIEFLKANDCGIAEDTIGCRYSGIAIRRYRSSKINSEELDVILFSSKDDVTIREKPTIVGILGKIILTPFAMVLDVLAIPLYIIGYSAK